MTLALCYNPLMNQDNRRSRVEDDDSLLASVAGVPLTRSARAGLCVVWAAFWAARFLLTDALPHLYALRLKSLATELLGEGPFDQAFTIGMMWLTIEVVVIAWHGLKGAIMLIAKTSKKSFRHELMETLADSLPIETLEAILEKKRNQAGANGVHPPNGDANPKT